MLNKVYKIFFDTEFTGLRQNTSLISIGCITETEEIFYFENTDYNADQVDEWIQNNVINNLKFLNTKKKMTNYILEDGKNINKMVGYGNFKFLKRCFNYWVSELFRKYQKDVLFVSDVSHYDAVLLFELFGGALQAPEYVVPFVWDINQDLCRYLNISPKEAFDLNREGFVSSKLRMKFTQKNKHNALHDAQIIQMIFEILYIREG